MAGLLQAIRDRFFPPPPDDTPAQRAALDAFTATLSLYHFTSCPYCARVRRTLGRLGLDVELRDISRDATHRADLVAGGGRQTVPCLRIQAGDEPRWLYESADIVRWLEGEAAAIRTRHAG